jgi:hypothetical protein
MNTPNVEHILSSCGGGIYFNNEPLFYKGTLVTKRKGSIKNTFWAQETHSINISPKNQIPYLHY